MAPPYRTETDDEYFEHMVILLLNCFSSLHPVAQISIYQQAELLYIITKYI